MSSVSEPKEQDDGLEAAVDQAIAACGGDTRAAIRALIVANNFWESEEAEHMGADMAIQFMLMTLFQIVSQMTEDPRGFRSDIHKELTGLVATYALPPMAEATERKIRAAAGRILDGIVMRSFEQSEVRKVS